MSATSENQRAVEPLAPGRPPRASLVLASALMLFVELALIRWTGSNVLHLSYFSNFVLLGSFLGIGLGFLRAGHRFDLSPWWPLLLVALVGFVLAFPVQVDQSSEQVLYFTGVTPTGLPAWVTLPLIFLAVAAVTCGLGEGVARLFPQFRPLEAYRWDIVGSLTGIAAFTLLAFLHAPPVVWGVLAAAGYLALRRGRPPLVVLASLVLAGRPAGRRVDERRRELVAVLQGQGRRRARRPGRDRRQRDSAPGCRATRPRRGRAAPVAVPTGAS
jgi:hypothetical protein